MSIDGEKGKSKNNDVGRTSALQRVNKVFIFTKRENFFGLTTDKCFAFYFRSGTSWWWWWCGLTQQFFAIHTNNIKSSTSKIEHCGEWLDKWALLLALADQGSNPGIFKLTERSTIETRPILASGSAAIILKYNLTKNKDM